MTIFGCRIVCRGSTSSYGVTKAMRAGREGGDANV
ncbi:hypothetical protein SNOG_11988 [Parastagonospora nodorum SN15]|uniref:Uncharacterized protein n=1 Tax=Phaeosphaeria nodorum (strain SN15 / ATCC MYA-4574 / FGSC 10173) TaxID=321614 RepID=Q0U8C6_PHANO|nr:hypothetical protein SNOG_11988 [Parastagonospora nodorum SN15]EAT80400.1 hypothetical protein SNOG_11988 [Parastagonospora nodorum SN15]